MCVLPVFVQESFAKDNDVTETSGEKAQESTVGESRASVNQQTFVTYKYIDPMVGMEAFRLLIPKGWQAEGGTAWSANPALPVQARFRFFNPHGAEQLEFFPTQAYFWTDNQVFLYTNPPGTLRFGTLVAQPVDLQTAFSNIFFQLSDVISLR